MATKVAINGFGRIGRLVARAILERTDHDLELVAINDLADAKPNALLFAFDSVHGRFNGEVSADGDAILVNGKDAYGSGDRSISPDGSFDTPLTKGQALAPRGKTGFIKG